MDANVLTTLGSAAAVMLSLLGIMAHLRREIREVRSELRAEIKVVDERVRDLQVDMGVVKYCLGMGGAPVASEAPTLSAS